MAAAANWTVLPLQIIFPSRCVDWLPLSNRRCDLSGALAAHADRKPWEDYAAAAAADCNRKRRVIMSFLLDAFVGRCENDPNGGCLKPKAHYFGKRCDADHTLLDFAVYLFRIEACGRRAAVAWAESRHSQASSPSSAFASFRSAVWKPSVNQPYTGASKSWAFRRSPRSAQSRARSQAARSSKMRDDWRRAAASAAARAASATPSVTGVESQAGACAQPVQLRHAKVLACRLGAGQALLEREPAPRPVGRAAARRRRAA